MGKRLVDVLADRGHDVTVATRGRAAVSFSKNVRRITLDRTDEASLKAGLDRGNWDIVYDQICFSDADAAAIIEAVAGKTGRYVLCSSAAVYRDPARNNANPLLNTSEDAFEPSDYPIDQKNEYPAASYENYAKGKRLAEAVVFQQAGFPVVAVRFPIILGPDDYSKRLRLQVRRIAGNEAVPVVNPEAAISLISSSDAAGFLAWLSTVNHTGPFNACSDGAIALKTIVQFIEEATGRAAIVKHQPDDAFSIFRAEESFTLSTAKAQRAGFAFSPTREWLRDCIRQEAAAAKAPA